MNKNIAMMNSFENRFNLLLKLIILIIINISLNSNNILTIQTNINNFNNY